METSGSTTQEARKLICLRIQSMPFVTALTEAVYNLRILQNNWQLFLEVPEVLENAQYTFHTQNQKNLFLVTTNY